MEWRVTREHVRATYSSSTEELEVGQHQVPVQVLADAAGEVKLGHGRAVVRIRR